MDRSLSQCVAIVDGVCIEVRNHSRSKALVRSHSRSKAFVEEQQMGIFCSWGVRIEQQVQVSEEGIEEYFNSLAGKPWPEGLKPKAPFEEEFCRFPLASMSRASANTKPKFQVQNFYLLILDINLKF